MRRLCNSTENKFEDCAFASLYQKNGLAVKDEITSFVPIKRLLGSIKKNGSAVPDEIACFVPDYAEKSGEGVEWVQKKSKAAQLQLSVKNECFIRDFEASTFQSD